MGTDRSRKRMFAKGRALEERRVTCHDCKGGHSTLYRITPKGAPKAHYTCGCRAKRMRQLAEQRQIARVVRGGEAKAAA